VYVTGYRDRGEKETGILRGRCRTGDTTSKNKDKQVAKSRTKSGGLIEERDEKKPKPGWERSWKSVERILNWRGVSAIYSWRVIVWTPTRGDT
jgi:hypothetical protein